MKNLLNKKDELTRREVVKTFAKGFLGLSMVPFVSNAQSQNSNQATGKAKSVIFIRVTGGLSHVDSFDIKEANKDSISASAPIKTSADGIRIGKYFPKMAEQMHHCAIINSMYVTQGTHKEAGYFMNTGYESRGTIVHPDLGSWLCKVTKKSSTSLPPFIKVGTPRSLGGGFLGSSHAALPLADPMKGLLNTSLPKGSSKESFDKKYSLMNELNNEFSRKFKSKNTTSYHQAYEDSLKLMNSKDLDVFNASKEDKKMQELYGKNKFGQGCLVARRLVEKGIKFVEITHGGWDHHFNIYEEFGEKAVSLDQGVGALIKDLSSRGLLDSTLVVVATEFGRSPELNSRAGRNHHPVAFSNFLAGGGIKGGQKYGETDPMGNKIIKNKVETPDFHATIAHAMGAPLGHSVMSPKGRPITMIDKGKPILSIF
ncbi:MAG: DUF1501 domain-containing protein [Lentisphaeraceae bacterium]|nr:DUF1501 domain-containing protein [Lentisphaeraceae bacterium]